MRTSLLVVAVSFLVACGGGWGDTQSSSDQVTKSCGASTTGPVQGVDVSKYQGNFNWSTANVAFGYARISDGSLSPDSTFVANWANMQAAGVLRGAYQFFRPEQDATAQAQMVVNAVGMLGPTDLPAMIDVEIADNQSPATIAAGVKTWLGIVTAGTGKTPIIYTGASFWQTSVQDTSFGAYPVWIAAYGPTCPSLPPGWTSWAIWQYSDGNNALDHDVFNGSLADLQALAAGSNTPPPPPPPINNPDAGAPPDSGTPSTDCYSDTLGMEMPQDSCVWSSSDGVEYQCIDGHWRRGERRR
jgi:lysozyme